MLHIQMPFIFCKYLISVPLTSKMIVKLLFIHLQIEMIDDQISW